MRPFRLPDFYKPQNAQYQADGLFPSPRCLSGEVPAQYACLQNACSQICYRLASCPHSCDPGSACVQPVPRLTGWSPPFALFHRQCHPVINKSDCHTLNVEFFYQLVILAVSLPDRSIFLPGWHHCLSLVSFKYSVL